MASNQFQYFENGFLVLNASGGTTNGKAILRLTDISLSINRDIDETTSFDQPNFTKVKQPTYLDWSVSCSGVMSIDVGESEFHSTSSGDTKIVNTLNGYELVELAKTRSTTAHIIIKLADAFYQKGKVIISS